VVDDPEGEAAEPLAGDRRREAVGAKDTPPFELDTLLVTKRRVDVRAKLGLRGREDADRHQLGSRTVPGDVRRPNERVVRRGRTVDTTRTRSIPHLPGCSRDLRSYRPSSGGPGNHSVAVGVDVPAASRAPGAAARGVVVLPALAGDPRRPFVLVAEPTTHAATAARVAELEYWLGQVGAIVVASGILQRVGAIPDLADRAEVSRLSRRQWEVLSRVVQGDSVAEIADALFVSRSTVRNHLSGIYAHFGVHSRAELLARLRKPDSPAVST
jgi:DNA-binding CsgD family transcriptional regulator